MNDYRDLGLGFFGAVAALAAYIGLVGACFGGETLQATIVTDAPAERQYVPQTGDRVICNDFTYIIMAVPDWELWTNRISQLEAVASRRWANEHKTDAGRRAWHGAVVKTEWQAEQRQVVYTYADGYQWMEKVQGGYRRPVNADRNTATNRPPKAVQPPRRPNLPAKLAAKRERMEKVKVREVNATFGPGGKVISSKEVQ